VALRPAAGGTPGIATGPRAPGAAIARRPGAAATPHASRLPVPATTPEDALAEAIIVPNTLWSPERPDAYGGEALADTPTLFLRDYEASGESRHDNARWSGALEVIPTKADYVLDLIRANSLWPLLSGLACCAFEMMSAATSKNDMDRWGMFPFRASPRQADVLIVAGTCTTKMAGPLLRLWEQMPEPKWCVAMGDCTCSGGRYKRSYSTIQGIDRIMPVDVYVPGCPPRPEGLIFAMMRLQQLVKDRRGHWPERRVGPTVPDGV
jgi:NADH-quinone oxidoreductase subunit B